jgi:hypothetical protein
MSASITLRPEELRIIGHSITWQMYIRHENTPAPRLGAQETGILTSVFNNLCDLNRSCFSGAEAVSVEIGEPCLCEPGRIRLPQAHFRLMTAAVASFFEELRSSPIEIEVLTGSPWSKTAELLTRLQTTDREAA